MTTIDLSRIQDALRLGHGPRTLDVFLEPTCPFSARAWGKLDELLARAGAERLTIRLRLQSQPWHLFSSVTTRAVLAAASLPEGAAAVRAVLGAIFTHRAEFEPADHCSGEVLDRTPRQVLARIEALSGLALAAAWETPALTAAVKWQARHARQNGIHVSPTFLIDGLAVPEMGSGETVDAWLERLGLAG